MVSWCVVMWHSPTKVLHKVSTVIHGSLDHSNFICLREVVVSNNETFRIGNILVIWVNYLVSTSEPLSDAIAGCDQAISAKIPYQPNLGQWTSYISSVTFPTGPVPDPTLWPQLETWPGLPCFGADFPIWLMWCDSTSLTHLSHLTPFCAYLAISSRYLW